LTCMSVMCLNGVLVLLCQCWGRPVWCVYCTGLVAGPGECRGPGWRVCVHRTYEEEPWQHDTDCCELSFCTTFAHSSYVCRCLISNVICMIDFFDESVMNLLDLTWHFCHYCLAVMHDRCVTWWKWFYYCCYLLQDISHTGHHGTWS